MKVVKKVLRYVIGFPLSVFGIYILPWPVASTILGILLWSIGIGVMFGSIEKINEGTDES